MSPKKNRYIVRQTSNRECDMDPRLESVATAVELGNPIDEKAVRETGAGHQLVEVIATVTDPSIEIEGLQVATAVRHILTGTVDVKDIQRVAAHSNVRRLEMGRKIFPDLHDSVREIRARPSDLATIPSNGDGRLDGRGTIVGIVDFGCDFLHQNFRREDGSTRILFFWDQEGAPDPRTPSPQPYGYGREFSEGVLNEALSHASRRPPAPSNMFHPEDPGNEAYDHLGYRPNRPSILGGRPAHGTHVMDIAVGNGRGSSIVGVAPGAEVIFVELGGGDENDETESFGNSVRLLQAVDYIFRKADELNRPAVVNLSLGTFGGPHDGTSPAEQHFDGLLDEPNRAVVIAAGNSHDSGTHASGLVSEESPVELKWKVQETVRVDNEVEIWYSGADALEATLVDPDGEVVSSFPLSDQPSKIEVGGEEVAVVNHSTDSVNGDNRIDIFLHAKPTGLSLEQSLPTGVWRVKLKALSRGQVAFHAWIERTDFRFQSRFGEDNRDATHTLGSICCGQKTITVGAYNARGLSRPLSSFTSEGPTRDGRQKPEVSAPGGERNDGVLAARSMTHTGRTAMPGTSMAAPHVTGLIALLLQVAGRELNADEIRSLVLETARRDPPPREGWHPRYGLGRIDGHSAVTRALPADAPVPAVAAVLPQEREAGVSTGNRAAPRDLLPQLAAMAASTGTRIRLEIEPAQPGR